MERCIEVEQGRAKGGNEQLLGAMNEFLSYSNSEFHNLGRK